MTITELKDRVKKEEGEQIIIDKYLRNISVYITYVIAKTSMSANQVSFIMVLTGLAASIAFSFNKMILGAILMQLWYIIDFVDGEIARLKNQCSITGLYFDHLIHYVNQPIFFIGIAVGLYKEKGMPYILLFGFLAAFFELMSRATEDTYFMIIYKNLIGKSLKGEIPSGEGGGKKKTIKELIIEILHYPIVMNIISIGIIIDSVLIKFNTVSYHLLTTIIIVSYGVCIPIYNISRMFHHVISFKLDKEIQHLTKD